MFLWGIKTTLARAWEQMKEIDHVCSGSMNLGHIQAIKGVADSVNSKKCTWQWPGSSGKLSLFSNTLRWTPSEFLDCSQRLQPHHFFSLPAVSPWHSQAERGKWGGSWHLLPLNCASVAQDATATAVSSLAPAYLWGKVKLQSSSEQIQERYNNLCRHSRKAFHLPDLHFSWEIQELQDECHGECSHRSCRKRLR